MIDPGMRGIDSKRVSERFRRSLASYDREAVVQREVGEHLVALLGDRGDLRSDRVLDIGCCTGAVTEILCAAHPVRTLFLNDLVAECCHYAARRLALRVVDAVETLPGNIETITLPDSLDLVVSSSTFQWVEDLAGCLRKIAGALLPGGYLACSLFGPGTMAQFKELTGIGLDYLSERQLSAVLTPAFEIVHMEEQHRTVRFAEPREILRHIQLTGVGGVGSFRWTPSRLRRFERLYRERYGDRLGVPLDYAPIFVIAKKRETEAG